MTTRRALLTWAGGAAGVAVLGGCTARAAGRATAGRATAEPTPPDLLFVTTTAGLIVIGAATGKPTLPAPAALATADWRRVVTAEPDAKGVRLVTREVRSGQVISGGTLRDRLEPRVVSPDGRLVALTTPAGHVPAAPYRPAGRDRTTVVVADSGGERRRLDLPGNVEPESFSPNGSVLYVLDYLPPADPDRYRVRAIELATGSPRPLLTRLKTPVPAGAEEEMRGEGRQAVYDANRKTLFTLYTHQPDHEHTRDLVSGGARADAPRVHAFVHTLGLELGMAYCIDLPAPFGQGPPAGHAIAARPDGGRLYVVDAGTGRVAHIDPDKLIVERVTQFAAPGMPGAAAAVATPDNGLVVAAGTRMVCLPIEPASGTAKRELALAMPVRGLALGEHNQVYVGQRDAVVAYDLATGRESSRTVVPDLVALRHVSPATR